MNVKLEHITSHTKAFGYLGRVDTAEGLLMIHRRQMLKQNKPTIPVAEGSFVVYVNSGRMVIDCLCQAGVIVDAVTEMGCCFDCGRVYTSSTLLFPKQDDLEEIDHEMGKKAAQHRNFDPRQGHTLVGLKEPD